MSIFNKIEEKVVTETMRQTIRDHLKGYKKKGVIPTVEQIIQDIKSEALETLAQHGYSIDRIKEIVEEEIRRLK